MKFLSPQFLVISLLLMIEVHLGHGDSAHWSYDDTSKWPGLCNSKGRLQHIQSPINFNSFFYYHPKPLIFKNYGLINTTHENDGHSLKFHIHPLSIPYEDEDTKGASWREEHPEGDEEEREKKGEGWRSLRPQVSGGGLPGTYVLDSFHFHWGSNSHKGSEHLLKGCAFSGEMHLVHYRKDYGSLSEALKHPHGVAVLGVWLIPGHVKSHHSHLDIDVAVSKADYFFTPGTVQLPGACGYHRKEHEASSLHWFDMITPHDNAETPGPLTPVHLRQMLPYKTDIFYRYEGSLTTPPCTEKILWTVFEDPVPVTEEFLAGLRLLVQPEDESHRLSNNFRPTQSILGRSVFYSGNDLIPSDTCRRNQDRHSDCTAFPELHFVSNIDNDVSVFEDEEEENCPAARLASPINLHLSKAQPTHSRKLKWKHIGHCKGVKVLNNGYNLQVLYPTASPEWELIGSNLTKSYYLAGMQLRWGSEHHLGGLSFPLEIQLVHYNSRYKNFKEALKKPDGIVVVSKFFQEPVAVDTTLSQHKGHGIGHNNQLEGIIHAVENNAQKPLGYLRITSPDVPQLMGDTSTYYEYRGTLGLFDQNTCPSNTATWMVIRQTGEASREQLASFKEMRSADGSSVDSNNRPLAHSKDRQVLLRIDSRELTHEFKQLLKRSKRTTPLEEQPEESTPIKGTPIKPLRLSPSAAATSLKASSLLMTIITSFLIVFLSLKMY